MTVNELIKYYKGNDDIKFRKIRFFSEKTGFINFGETNYWMISMAGMEVKTHFIKNDTLFIKVK